MKLIYSGLLVILSTWFHAYAAAPGMHIYLANKYLIYCKTAPEQIKPLYIGTLWPDIRYLKVIGRDTTHEKGVGLKDLHLNPEDDAFPVGKKLHAYVDERREKFAVSYGVYKLLKAIPRRYHASFLKFVEDEIIWDRLAIQDIINILSTTYVEEEFDGKISKISVLLWHGWLTHYFQQRPSQMIKDKVDAGEGLLNIPATELKKWVKLLPKIAKSKEMLTYLDALLNHFDEAFKSLKTN